MNERTLEIIVTNNIQAIFGDGWRLLAQQLVLEAGRIDLLLSDHLGDKHLIELKKGKAREDAAKQAIGYAAELTRKLDGHEVQPWVVAHELHASLIKCAADQGVLCKALPVHLCEQLALRAGLSELDLMGNRRRPGVLHGGSGKPGVWELVDLEAALAELDAKTSRRLRDLSSTPHIELRCGLMQIVLMYRGVKVGGVNRGHRHFYISEGVVLNSAHERALVSLGFFKKTKHQTGGHEHVWWQAPLSNVDGFEGALQLSFQTIDHALELTS